MHVKRGDPDRCSDLRRFDGAIQTTSSAGSARRGLQNPTLTAQTAGAPALEIRCLWVISDRVGWSRTTTAEVPKNELITEESVRALIRSTGVNTHCRGRS